MKKILLLVISFTLISATTNAQYRINKTKYDHHNYVYQAGDPYNPTAKGIWSLLIPGLGQMTSGEGGRGVGFLLGCMGSFGVFIIGGTVVNTSEHDPKFTQKQATGSILILAGLAGSTVFWLWSVGDAVKVAKINNMAWRDKRKSGQLQLSPYLTPMETGTVPVGLTLRMRF
jgi:hypothetical protein